VPELRFLEVRSDPVRMFSRVPLVYVGTQKKLTSRFQTGAEEFQLTIKQCFKNYMKTTIINSVSDNNTALVVGTIPKVDVQ
jgi:meiotically up-regulated gene 157 (Mug157) protein